MNPEQREQAEREQAGRVLPPAGYPEPAPGRTEARRRHLLSEIDRQTHARSRPALRPRRRMVLVLGAAMAAGATVVVLSLGSGTTGGPNNAPPASAASVQVLERAALAAGATSPVKVVAGQYVYVRTVGHASVLSENKAGQMELLRRDEAMEQWTSVDGSERTLQRKAGKDSLLPEDPGSLNSPTYNFLAALPTDPEALLKQIRDDAERNHGAGSGSTTGPDHEAFVTIGDLPRSGVTPPATTAAPLPSSRESMSPPTP
ncbi:CU044_5270 family protein [Streptomyces sp. NPDC005389]|uniref:CU044_5270 family protein n=1 Tax=Streptomyces sp. NPDC005389 TaxID=3157040 RepID=UPI00339EC7EB